MAKNGLTVNFYDSKCHILHKGKLVGSAKVVYNMYKLDIRKDHKIFQATKIDLWHKRLGHTNQDDLYKLSQVKARGIELTRSSEEKRCISCLFGKQSKIPYQNSRSSTTDVLQIVHSDVCGPMEPDSIGGSKYYVIFVDDFSSKVFVYIMKMKSEVYKYFKIFPRIKLEKRLKY